MDFLHTYLHQPTLTPEGRIVHAVHLLKFEIKYVKSNNTVSQLAAIQDIKSIFNTWQATQQQKDIPPCQSTMLQLQQKTQGTPHNIQKSNTRTHQEQKEPTVTSKGDQLGNITKGAPHGTITNGALHKQLHVQEPISHRIRSKKAKPSQADTNPIAPHTRLQMTALAAHMLAQQATSCLVLNKEMGEYMRCAQLRRHPQYAGKWDRSFAKKKWAEFDWE